MFKESLKVKERRYQIILTFNSVKISSDVLRFFSFLSSILKLNKCFVEAKTNFKFFKVITHIKLRRLCLCIRLLMPLDPQMNRVFQTLV
jgi:hypothetical protein